MPSTMEEKLDQHIKECMVLQQETRDALRDHTDAQRQTSNALVILTGQHDNLARQWKTLQDMPVKIIKWVGVIVAGSLITVMAQSWYQSTVVEHNTNDAASAAHTTVANQQTVIHKLDQLQGTVANATNGTSAP